MRPQPPQGRPASIEYVQYRRIVQRDPCSYCDGPGGTKDHITPKPSGGPPINTPENLTGACSGCNMAKANLGLLEFLFFWRWGLTLAEAAPQPT